MNALALVRTALEAADQVTQCFGVTKRAGPVSPIRGKPEAGDFTLQVGREDPQYEPGDVEHMIMAMLFAGHDTTSSLLTWTWYLLSKWPAVEEKMHAELATVLGGRAPGLDDIPNLPYLRQVFDETLRLYSPIPILARDLTEDDRLNGYDLPKGSLVVLALYNTHRHPEFWERPEEFYPEHFAEAAVAARPRYAYLPFGAGPRICIGMHFALMEAALVMGEVAQRFALRLARPHDGKVRYVGVTRPDEPILMKLSAR